jgi:tripartite-type tricarboxylate transporter receptor subunit TctC
MHAAPVSSSRPTARSSRRRQLAIGLLAAPALAAALLGPSAVNAQSFPSKPLRLVVPFAPGGNTDVVARLLAAKMAEQMGQPVVVENRPGANGIVGSESVAKSPGDGYSLLVVTPSHAINPVVTPKLPYDTEREFTPITLVSRTPYVLAVAPSVNAANVQELIRLARAQPDSLSFASSGIGTGAHLVSELLMSAANIRMVHVTYKGTSQAMPDVISGRVSMIFDVEQVLMPHIRSGKLRGMAVTGLGRTPTAPELPTMAESGVSGFNATTWVALLSAGGVPEPIAQRLATEARKALQSSELKARLEASGAEVVANSPAELGAFLKAETAKWAELAKTVKLTP